MNPDTELARLLNSPAFRRWADEMAERVPGIDCEVETNPDGSLSVVIAIPANTFTDAD